MTLRGSIGQKYYAVRHMAFVAGWVLSAPLGAQSFDLPLATWQHSSWTGVNGPPVPGAHYLMRSPDGYLWLSANNSIIRFDGVRFTVFDSTTVPALRSKELGEWAPTFVDRSGAMWLSGPAGECVRYFKGGFHHELTLESGTGPVAEDSAGLIWTNRGRLQRLVDGKLVPMVLPSDSLPVSPWTAIRDTGTGYWVGSRSQGLWHLSRTGAVRRFGAGDVRPLLQQRDGTLWVVGVDPGGIARLEGNRWKPLALEGDTTRIHGRFAHEGPDGAAWFQTNAQNLIRYKQGRVESFTVEHGLSDPRVNDVLIEPSGVVWISTDAGLDRIRPAAFTPLDPTRRFPARGITLSFTHDASGALWYTALGSDSLSLLDGTVIRGKGASLAVRRMGRGKVVGPSLRGGVWIKNFGELLRHLDTNGVARVVEPSAIFVPMRINGVVEAP
ncbi:MAG TPA: hypothetical protein VG817_02165, partial [Gemmatimonadales bacterium]|nr:hypothetical protein [Gemmatimonadales bacterium]